MMRERAYNASQAQYPNLWQGLVGFWDTGIGVQGPTLRNLSGKRLDGSLTNMTGGIHPTSGWYPSRHGMALSFDGTNNFVQIPNGYQQTIKGNDYHSISIWFNARTANNYPVLLSTVDLFIELNNIDGFLWGYASGVYRTYSGIAIDLNKWHNVTVVKTGTGDSGNLYFNGILQTSYSGSFGSVTSNDSEYAIGVYQPNVNAYSFNGLINRVMIYNRSITLEEVRQLFERQSPLTRKIQAVGKGTGGGTLSHTPSDSVTLSDATTKAEGLARSDSVTLADAAAKGGGLAKSDSITLSDSPSIGLGRAHSISDSVTLTDAAAKADRLAKSDSVTLSDATVKSGGLSKTDAVTLTDSSTKKETLSKSDSVTLSDAAAKSANANKTDSVSLSDSQARSAALNKTDSVTLSDSSTKSETLSKSDSVTLTDNATFGGVNLVDLVTLEDGTAKSVSSGKADSVSLTDSIGKAGSTSKADSVTLSDSVTQKTAALNPGDTVSLTDGIVKAVRVNSSDSVVLSDVINAGGSILLLSLSDGITLSDIVTNNLVVGSVPDIEFAPSGLTERQREADRMLEFLQREDEELLLIIQAFVTCH